MRIFFAVAIVNTADSLFLLDDKTNTTICIFAKNSVCRNTNVQNILTKMIR